MNLDPQIQAALNQWLGSEYDAETQQRVQQLIDSQDEKALVDAFYKKLEFGTGGLRGIMGDGPNRMNKYTVGAATQGFANYLNKTYPQGNIKVAIAFDSRNNSQYFAQIVANIFSANNIKVYLYEALRPTPQLSYTIRSLQCQGGVVLTASHNPKEYNGYKAYWNDGGQLLTPHDKNVIEEVNAITSVTQINFEPKAENIELLGEAMDRQYRMALKGLSLDNGFVATQNDLKIVFSSIHGTGITQVPQTLKLWGFNNVHVIEEQAEPNGNFPTVVYPNPEEEEAMTLSLQKARELDADIAMACDPDSDRVGCAVKNHQGEFVLLNGNQIGSLLVHYVLTRKSESQAFSGHDFVVRTIVTTALVDQIAAQFNIPVYHTLTGFKYIGDLITKLEGREKFLVGGEESYGYMVGDLTRDKDAIVSCAFIAEMTAYYKNQGKSLFDALLDMYAQFGFYREKLVSITKKGKEGAEEIAAMMTKMRQNPPSTLGGSKVVVIKDYQSLKSLNVSTGQSESIDMPKSNVLQFITEDGSTISARPSGTEPKIKFYCSVNSPLDDKSKYNETAKILDQKVDALMGDLIGEN
ncbi:phospho-sugar mutase [bacterium]|nr:phospho-sugar mutase [bacterium]